MQRTLIALACGLALAAGGAFAQQTKPANDPPGPTLSEKAKEAAETIGEKTKAAVEKMKDLAHESAQKSKAGDESAKADDVRSSKIEQMQERADADLKAAKAKCDGVEPRAQKTVCEKQAAVAHANAELRIAKAHAAAQAGKTSTMGAGKAAR